MRAVMLSLTVLTTSTMIAQSDWRSLEEAEFTDRMELIYQVYEETEHYIMDYTLASFKGHTAIVPEDISDGFLARSSNSFHQMQMGIRSIQNDTVKVVVEPEEQMIFLGEATQQQLPLLDVSLEELGITAWILEGPLFVAIRYDYPLGYDYERVECVFRPGHWMSKMTLYYREPLAEDPTDPNSPTFKPKVVMKVDKPETGTQAVQHLSFEVGEYVTWTANGPEAVPEDYELFDTRYQ